MSTFFIPSDNISDNSIFIDGSDYNHIKNVLRMRIGDSITVNDSKGFVYDCIIDSFDSESVNLKINSCSQSNTELSMDIVLFQGYPKGDKLELIIQKAVELGVTKIVPVMMERTIVKLEPKKVQSRIDRYNKISEAAAKQSGRSIVPEVTLPLSYKDALSEASSLDMVLLPYENADGMKFSFEKLSEAVKRKSVGVFIGPEGGFSTNEINLAKDKNFNIISLGKRILRTETAGLCVLSNLMMMKEYNDTLI